MDIENMHPFCLPFSLCHDATSSSIIGDDEMECKTHTRRDISDKLNNNNNNNNNNNDDEYEDPIRLKRDSPSSPIGDLLVRLDAGRRSPLLCDHESFIDISGDHDGAYHSLHLDIDMSTEDEFGLRDMDQDDNHNCHEDDNDWHLSISATHDCPLFSPSGGLTASIKHRARHHHNPKGSPCSSIFSAHHQHQHQHQVFQHVVDPIDIKSSPTLAQLNLNSNEDPTDGLWTTGGPGSQGALSSANATYLPTSSTSTLISSTTHLHRQHQASLSSLLSSTNPDLLASSLANHNNHCNSSISSLGAATNSLNTAAAHWCSAPNGHQPNNFLATCNHVNNTLIHQQAAWNTQFSTSHQHHQMNTVQNTAAKKNINQGQHSSLIHQNQQQTNGMLVNNASCSCRSQQQPGLNGALEHQRCSSPLVTSSSSPLSSQSNSGMQLNCGGDAQYVGATDSKLKENIEYLTVLLCNGSNKLDMTSNQVRQQPNSSTMVKSYSTLAQTLSTGPKLLERYRHNGPTVGGKNLNMQSNSIALASGCTTNSTVPICAGVNDLHTPLAANEVLPQCVMQINHGRVMAPNHCSHSNNQWLKPTSAVESSVSAADSTAENQNKLESAHGPAPIETPRARPGELKVLNSLLGANKYCSPGSLGSDSLAYPLNTPVWSNMTTTHTQNNLHAQGAPRNDANFQDDSIPVNGRPITLTPHSNVIIPQRLQQGIGDNSKSKVNQPKFAQPASPSTSSTTSSSGNLEIGSSSSSSTSSCASTTKTPRHPSGSSSSSSSSASCAGSTVKKGDQQQRVGQPGCGTRLSSLTGTDCSLSSHDEGFSSQMDQDECANSIRGNDSDDESDIDSDDESFYGDYTNSDLIGASISDNPECKWTLNMGRTRRNGHRRFFWQYNVQSKGPKGARICPTDGAEDPFVLPEASDPVFSNECQIEGVKHSGKARRGDGNDLTPNPRKLLMIGLELKKLSKIINELAPVTDLPVNARNKTRKEKNKLASRACRLKKKAQHEANKIKLYGLQREHQQIVMAIYDARKTINKSLVENDDDGDGDARRMKQAEKKLSSTVKELLDQCSITVAGQTSDYVNSVLEKVVSGCIDGGLQT